MSFQLVPNSVTLRLNGPYSALFHWIR